MKIVGCDLHTRYQQVAMLDRQTGELAERRLERKSGEPRAFYPPPPACQRPNHTFSWRRGLHFCVSMSVRLSFWRGGAYVNVIVLLDGKSTFGWNLVTQFRLIVCLDQSNVGIKTGIVLRGLGYFLLPERGYSCQFVHASLIYQVNIVTSTPEFG